MDLKELYQTIDGNYEKAIARFLNEDMLNMFFCKYFDSTCFRELESAMEAEDIIAAFEASHSLKGLTQSMEFTKMAESCVLLTEDLRAGINDSKTKKYWEDVKKEYIRIESLWKNAR